MNFKEAYQKMLEGKKVKRKGRSLCCFYDSNENKFCTGDGVAITGITFEAALADDWEVVEERTVVEKTKSKVKVWKPNKNEKYCYIGGDGDIYHTVNANLTKDDCIFSIGNYFKTDEEAEHMVEKLKVIKELQDFAFENRDEEIDWYDKEQDKWEISYKDSNIEPICNNYYRSQTFNIYFTSLEIAQEAIKTIGEDRIKKYYFDIED